MPEGRALEQPTGDAGGEEGVAICDHADGTDEVDRLGVLHEEAARAGADRAGDVLVQLERRDDHDADDRSAGISRDLLGRPEAIAIGHADVEERDIDRRLVQRAQERFAAGCLRDDLDVGLRVQQRAEAGADQLVVVCERDSDHDSTRQGRRAMTIVPARAAGTRMSVAARKLRALPHAAYSGALGRVAREPGAVVRDGHDELVFAIGGRMSSMIVAGSRRSGGRRW